MSNELIFKALSSQTRIEIIKILSSKELHITGLAKEIGVSKPVISRHVKKLEKAGLIEKKVIGNVYILKAKFQNLEKVLEPFKAKSKIEINPNESIFDALKQIPNVKLKKYGKNMYIQSIDGEQGYFIYEVNGKLPKKPIDEYKIDKKIIIDLKKLVSVNKKNITINIKRNNKK